jgi:hypothetical protein
LSSQSDRSPAVSKCHLLRGTLQIGPVDGELLAGLLADRSIGRGA